MKYLVTGGTGFFGKSILDYRLRNGNNGLSLADELTILSRNPERFCEQYPELARQDGVSFVKGDVRDFAIPQSVSVKYDAILHMATDAVTTNSDEEQTSVILDGTKHVIDVAKRLNVSKILFASSGGVYGPKYAPVAEDADCNPTTAYGKGKLLAEKMLAESGLDVKIARCFAFTGPFLNRKIHFAIGNFIQNVLDDRPIVINGDGTPIRSYLYADDLVEWLMTILANGVSGRVYNVGSDEGISIRDLAYAVRNALNGKQEIKVMGTATGQPTSVYVPDITRARMELGLKSKFDLMTSIRCSVCENRIK